MLDYLAVEIETFFYELTLKTVVDAHSDERVISLHGILYDEAEIISWIRSASLYITAPETINTLSLGSTTSF
jgi:hypothetical protein